MFALSQCDPSHHPDLRAQLPESSAVDTGLAVRWRFSTKGDGWYVVFESPDLPKDLSEASRRWVERVHDSERKLRRIAEGSAEWDEAFAGLRNDPVSAQKIFECFRRRFEARLRWVKTSRRRTGLVTAICLIDGLGQVYLQVSWRDVWAGELEGLPRPDRPKFEAAVEDILRWGKERIQPVLDALNQKLRALYGERFRGLYVFGSYARPDAGIELPEDSDLDVAVLLTDFTSTYDEVQRTSEITSDLSLQHGLVVSLVHMREADFREGRTNFARVISEYAIPVK